MQYRRLGNCGLQVSVVGYGSWLTMKRVSQSTSDELVRTAYESGINFFDTANVYGNGETERILATSLQGFRRDTYVLATKVYFPYGNHPFEGVNDRGLSRKHVFEQCHRSLAQLQTDYIDLYQCHRFDENTPLVETCRAMNDLVVQGKVLYWGVSQWSADQIRQAVEICNEHDWHRPRSNQPQYNMLQRQSEAEVLPTCRQLGLGVVAYSPLSQGVLTGKYAPAHQPPTGSRAADGNLGQWMEKVLTAENLEIVGRLSKLADGMRIRVSQLALAWCLRRPELSSCIVGATRPEQLAENVKAAGVELDKDVLDRIKVILGE
ncbi:MAG: aldo/keto reductase [Planctomycetes bacterium]|nr:aldo/keto reductase [Planctomycetota bacterium]NOG52927.1 aldo/keto reductase family protein [Planctomycetota bacterium]